MKFLFSSLCFLVFFLNNSFSQVNPFGQPFIKNYSIKDYNAKNQNWAIARDSRGVMYFANNDGVLEYDGRNWELIKVNKGVIVRSLAVDSTGTIFVGAENEFGYIQANEFGKLYYSSLSDSLKTDDQGFSNILMVYVNKKGVLFCSNKKIFRYHNSSLFTINLPKGGFLSHLANGNIYMGDYWEGLMVLENDSFIPCKGGNYFAEKDIFEVIPYKNSMLLIATSNHGLYIYDPETGSSTKPNYPDYITLHKFITDFYLYNVDSYKSGLIISTLYGGTVIVDSSFSIKEVYNKANGLQDEVILGDFLTSTSSATVPLWLSLNNGISKVEVNSPFRIFNEKSGLNDEILDIKEFKGSMYFATINGVYKLENNKELPSFQKVEQTEGECWSIIELNGKLIVCGGYNFFIHNGTSTKRIETNEMVFKLYPSKKYSSRVYVGESKGISIFNVNNDKIVRQSKLNKITERVLTINEDKEGNLWLTTVNNELLRVQISEKDTVITNFKDSLGYTPSESLYAFELNNEIYFSTHNSLLQYCAKTNRIISASNLDSIMLREAIGVLHFAQDFEDNIWLVTNKNKKNTVNLYKNQGNNQYKAHNTPFERIPTCVINSICPDGNGITWIGTSEGLFTFNTKTDLTYCDSFKTLIRKVYIGQDSVLFHGTYNSDGIISHFQPDSFIPALPYKFNGITFYYSSPFFIEENETRYSYFLEGFDSESSGWSNWTKEPKKEYTNLSEGFYTFRVKAINIYGNVSEEATYSFEILPPWYRTVWAIIGYIIIAILVIVISVKFYTRKLEADKKRLEGIVKERTAEVVSQKIEIEHKNKEITDSIVYAKRIQEALLPVKNQIEVPNLELFVFFRPKDIVSGDFYFIRQIPATNTLIATAADCTGHGVPGAFMSMLGISFLNELIAKQDILHSDEILNLLRLQVIASLNPKGLHYETKDGMDISLVVYNYETNHLEFSGANNPLYYFHNGEFTEIKANKMPVGLHERCGELFQRNEITPEPGDIIYLFSDGFIDQFGGENGKKYLSKNFKEFLMGIHQKPMQEQEQLIAAESTRWRGNIDQIDDQVVMGIRFLSS
ncbi:MAG: SpoIIE family protein phosphatase [Tenuifilaceae bacterium]